MTNSRIQSGPLSLIYGPTSSSTIYSRSDECLNILWLATELDAEGQTKKYYGLFWRFCPPTRQKNMNSYCWNSSLCQANLYRMTLEIFSKLPILYWPPNELAYQSRQIVKLSNKISAITMYHELKMHLLLTVGTVNPKITSVNFFQSWHLQSPVNPAIWPVFKQR